MTPVPLAYKYVATVVMLLEINYCASRLHLTLDLPVRVEDVNSNFIVHPKVMGFQGRLNTQKYTFVFAKSGRLRFIVELAHPFYRFKWGSPEFSNYYHEMAKSTSERVTH